MERSRLESDAAYLSLITPPEGVPDREVIDAIVESVRRGAPRAGEIDPHTLKLRFGLTPPFVLGLVPLEVARLCVGAIDNLGGAAFAPTIAELESLGPTLKIKDLRVENGALSVDLWHGPSTRIEFRQIECIVRAHLSDTQIRRTPSPYGRSVMGPRTMVLTIPTGPRKFRKAITTSETSTSDKLDLHTTAGDVLQVDGDKFAFGALGAMRGYSDKSNMDALFEMLQHVAGDAIADNFFPLFKPIGSISNLRVPHATLNADDLAFAFYSRWVALMYRYLSA